MKKRNLFTVLIIFIFILLIGVINKNKENELNINSLKSFKTDLLEPIKDYSEIVIKKQPIRVGDGNVVLIEETKDLNLDKKEDSIKVKFTSEGYNIEIKIEDKTLTLDEENINGVIPEVHFEKLEFENMYLVINNEGRSGDPSSYIYKINEDKITKVLETIGYITRFDENGRCETKYSTINQNEDKVLSQYDTKEGSAVFNKDENLIGQTISFKNKMILFKDKRDESKFYKSYISDITEFENYENTYGKENIVKVIDQNETLTILNIDYTGFNRNKDGVVKNIPIKVKDKYGNEGWLISLNGGD